MAMRHGLRVACATAAVLLVGVVIACTAVAILCGPASHLYATGPVQPLSGEYPGGKVSVQNPDLTQELEIFRASGVFEIVPADQARRAVELHPITQAGVSGNPLVLTWATGGLVPSTVPMNWTFSYTLHENGVASEQRYELRGERRVSLAQHLYRPFRSDSVTLGSILASEYQRSR